MVSSPICDKIIECLHDEMLDNFWEGVKRKKKGVRDFQKEEENFMAIVFRAGNPNFPANQNELDTRLKEIEKLINNEEGVPKVNIKFSEAAFKLMEDCALITESNLKVLCSAQSCKSIDSNFKFPFNPDEGPLRLTNDNNDVFDSDGCRRFYNGKKIRIESNGQIFLLSNDWYSDHHPYKNKRAFYNWLKRKAQDACENHWIELALADFFNDETDTIDSADIDKSENIDEFSYSYSGISIDSYTGSAEQVTIPAQIDDLPVTSIGNCAFRDCANLKSVIIPDSVTSIGDMAFSGCTSLKEIVIPNSVISIGYGAFDYCEHLEVIYIDVVTLLRESVKDVIDTIREQNPSCKILPIPKE